MELPQRKPNRLRSYDYSQNGAYFLTICTNGREKILSTVGTPLPGCPQKPCIHLQWHGEVADRIIRQMGEFYAHISVDKYVVMPDHIHFLLHIDYPDGHPRTGVPTSKTSTIAHFVGTFKRFCNREYGGNIWQPRFYDHVIRNQHDYDEIWEYIENNPRKWLLDGK